MTKNSKNSNPVVFLGLLLALNGIAMGGAALSFGASETGGRRNRLGKCFDLLSEAGGETPSREKPRTKRRPFTLEGSEVAFVEGGYEETLRQRFYLSSYLSSLNDGTPTLVQVAPGLDRNQWFRQAFLIKHGIDPESQSTLLDPEILADWETHETKRLRSLRASLNRHKIPHLLLGVVPWSELSKNIRHAGPFFESLYREKGCYALVSKRLGAAWNPDDWMNPMDDKRDVIPKFVLNLGVVELERVVHQLQQIQKTMQVAGLYYSISPQVLIDSTGKVYLTHIDSLRAWKMSDPFGVVEALLERHNSSWEKTIDFFRTIVIPEAKEQSK